MSTIITLDRRGRVVLPKAIRDRLHLEAGSMLRLEVVGNKLELAQEVEEVRLVRRGNRRVVVGWKGFNAARAVREMREEQKTRLGMSPAK